MLWIKRSFSRRSSIARRSLGLALLAAAALCAVIVCAGSALAAETLSLGECLAIAEAHHPSLAGAAASISADIGRLKSVLVADRLTIDASASQGRSGSDERDDSSSFSARAGASLKLYDSGRNRYRADAQRETLSSTIESAEQTRRDVRAGVKSAYTDLLLSEAIVALRAESVRAYEEHLAQARGFYEAGSRALYDVTQAEVELGNARLALVEAQSTVVMDRAALLNAMGVTIIDEFSLAPVSWDLGSDPLGPDYWELSSEAEGRAFDAALANRADLIAAEHRVASSRASLAATARANSPTITLSSGWSASGSHIANTGKGWSTELSASFPIVDGGEMAASLMTSRAGVDSALASLDALRQDVMLEVRRALNSLRTAREQIGLAELTLVNAEENYRLATGRYETGVGTALEVSDALVSLTDANVAKSRAQNARDAALISIERAIGIELTER